MATATAKQPLIPLEIRIEATAMAIREEVMNYFKGTCVERLTECNNVKRGGVRSGQLQYQYQRIDLERENPQIVYLNSLPLMTLRKIPDRLTLDLGVLQASPGLKKLHNKLESFLKHYLVAVKVETDKTKFKGNIIDEKLFTAVPRVREDNAYYNMEYVTARTSAIWSEIAPSQYYGITDDTPF